MVTLEQDTKDLQIYWKDLWFQHCSEKTVPEWDVLRSMPYHCDWLKKMIYEKLALEVDIVSISDPVRRNIFEITFQNPEERLVYQLTCT